MKTLSALRPVRLKLLSVAIALAAGTAQAGNDAETILSHTCAACHTPEGNGHYSRISHQRKTPEGWLMSIARMQVMHGVQISDEDRRTLVKYLADHQGLAPSETAGVRYALERRLNTKEEFKSQAFTETCARCHSGARVALQRRPASEWTDLVHFHLGQWPALEYQAMARDRDWLNLALNKMVPELASDFPYDSKAWNDWQAAPKADLNGQWRFSAHMPGKGDATGVMTVAAEGQDRYSVRLDGRYADGTALQGKGQALVYTGYEWRAQLDIDGVAMRQVFEVKDNRMHGRMFERVHDEVGLDVDAAKLATGHSTLLAAQPGYLRAGQQAELSLLGAGFDGKVELGDGIRVLKVLSNKDGALRLRVAVAADAKGPRSIRVGDSDPVSLVVYDHIDEVRVTPDYSVSRIGDNGGSTPKMLGLFEAEAWAAGPDGKTGTADDYRIGAVPARWHVEPFDDQAKEDNDVHFSGRMDQATGIFTPAGAGPNPERRMGTNNAGNLKVVAEVKDGDRTLSGSAHMIVAVQRWNNPPIP